MEKASILVQGCHVTTQGIVLRQAVYLIRTAETELSAVEASVNSVINALRVNLIDQDPPFRPLQLCWEEMFLFCDEEVALVPYERSVREQEAKRSLPEL